MIGKEREKTSEKIHGFSEGGLAEGLWLEEDAGIEMKADKLVWRPLKGAAEKRRKTQFIC